MQFINVPLNIRRAWSAYHDTSMAWAGVRPEWRGAAILAIVNVLFAIAILFYDRRRLRKELWIETNRCAACGYDLRATPDRCPECGRAAADV
ncbi:hypothetical protein BH10PLA1_BH10PLA1_15800 [soil metagenome]